MVAPWMEAALRAKGVWNDDGISRRARARRCADCGQVILVGLDGDRVAGIARVDPTPLTTLAEEVAVSPALARTCYRLRWVAGHYEVDPRTDWDREGSPADPGTVDVVPAHRCGAPVSSLTLTFHRERRPHTATAHPPY